MEKLRNKYLHLGSGFLMLMLFVSYVAELSLFNHKHMVDGQIIVHSHFYSGSADTPQHNHTSQQFSTISALSLYVSLTASMVLFSFVVGRICCKIETLYQSHNGELVSHFIQLRAPPVLC